MMRPLIVFVESYVAGGADRVVATLLPALPKISVELFINARCDPAVLLAGALPPNVTVHRYAWTTVAELAQWAARGRWSWSRRLRQLWSVVWRYPLLLLVFLRLRRLFLPLNPQAVWVNNGGYPGGDLCRIASLAAAGIEGCKSIHLVHSLAQPPRPLLKWPEHLLDRLLDRATVMVTVSRAAADSLKSNRVFVQTPAVLYNGLHDRAAVVPLPSGRVLQLLQVGYFDRNKNHVLSVRALGILKRAGIVNVHLTLIGKEAEPGCLDALHALIDTEGVHQQIIFAGFVSDVDARYDNSHALVLTSQTEGMPMCVLEAMRAGRTVVATPAGGVPEMVMHRLTGWVLSGGNAEELAQVWQRWLAHPQELREWGAAARQRFVELYLLGRQVERLSRLLELAPHPRSGHP